MIALGMPYRESGPAPFSEYTIFFLKFDRWSWRREPDGEMRNGEWTQEKRFRAGNPPFGAFPGSRPAGRQGREMAPASAPPVPSPIRGASWSARTSFLRITRPALVHSERGPFPRELGWGYCSRTIRYRAFPARRCSMASLIFSNGKCSVTGWIWCRSAKSSILARVAGAPTGEEETDRCPKRRGKT